VILSAAVTGLTGRFVLVLTAASLVLAAAPAADAQTVSDSRVWTGFVGQGRFSDASPWRWSFDTMIRTREGASTVDSVTGRVVISRQITGRSTVGAGYAYGTFFLDDGGTFDEHRFVQQFVWTRTAGVVGLSFRTRLEERLIEGNSGALVRARQHVRVTRSLIADGRLQLVASEELFLYANSTTRASSGFDSNRVFAGVRRAVTARTGVEIGYLNIYARIASSAYRRSHVLSATVQAAF